MIQKYRIGKNGLGWFIAIPTFTGSFSVLEGLRSLEEAWAVYDRHSQPW